MPGEKSRDAQLLRSTRGVEEGVVTANGVFRFGILPAARSPVGRAVDAAQRGRGRGDQVQDERLVKVLSFEPHESEVSAPRWANGIAFPSLDLGITDCSRTDARGVIRLRVHQPACGFRGWNARQCATVTGREKLLAVGNVGNQLLQSRHGILRGT